MPRAARRIGLTRFALPNHRAAEQIDLEHEIGRFAIGMSPFGANRTEIFIGAESAGIAIDHLNRDAAAGLISTNLDRLALTEIKGAPSSCSL